jgi:urease accessory protein
VVGGDTLDIAINAGPDSHALLTTPGASKFYRSDNDRMASQHLSLDIDAGATLEWLPQPTIYFPGARATLATGINLAPGGRYAGWEIHCFGRPANGEQFGTGEVSCQTRISIGGELRLVERLHSTGMSNISAATGLRGLPMQGSFIAAPCLPAHREALMQALHTLQTESATGYAYPAGISLVDEVLVVRTLGEQGEPMQALFAVLWGELRRLWLGTTPRMPRIWAT